MHDVFVGSERFCFSIDLLNLSIVCCRWKRPCLQNRGSFQFCVCDIKDCAEKTMFRPSSISTSIAMTNGKSIGMMYILKHGNKFTAIRSLVMKLPELMSTPIPKRN